MNLVVGQKVICVRDGWTGPEGYEALQLAVAGNEYIIRSIITERDGSQCLRFHWLVNPGNPNAGGEEPGFSVFGEDGIANFLPVTETKTDISVFTDILNRENSKVPA